VIDLEDDNRAIQIRHGNGRDGVQQIEDLRLRLTLEVQVAVMELARRRTLVLKNLHKFINQS
jgi:hypothetical protein